jgi:hypothetical protein
MRTSRRFPVLLALLAAPLLACGDSRGFTVFATAPGGGGGGGTGPALTGLTLTAGALSPSFSGTTTAYQATVPNTTASLRVIPSAASGSTIRVNGGAVASGTESPDIPLSIGTNTITVEVSGAGGTRTYLISVRRGP